MKVSDVFTPTRQILNDTSNSPNPYRFGDGLLYAQLLMLVIDIQTRSPRSRILPKNQIAEMRKTAFSALTDEVPLNDIYLPQLVEGLAGKAFLSEARDERDQKQGDLHTANYEAFFKPKGA